MEAKETEFKFLLEPEARESLLSILGNPLRERSFVNRYFTVSPASPRRDWVLRLRLEGGEGELTLKIGRELEPGIFDSVEYSERVLDASPASWEETEPVKELRREVSTAPLVLQGEARNHRVVCPAPIEVGSCWEIDSTHLPNGEVFHELEVEVESPSPKELERLGQVLRAWLKDAGISVSVSDKTKYARFLEAI